MKRGIVYREIKKLVEKKINFTLFSISFIYCDLSPKYVFSSIFHCTSKHVP